MPTPPRLSAIVLTWNEAGNIEACLRALARQTLPDLEVVVVDAASTDGTVAAVLALQPALPYDLRVVVAERRISIGEARNRGAEAARAPHIAYLSADTEADPEWCAQALAELEGGADLVFGRQVHVPHKRTVGAAVRGLRYHFPDGPTTAPARYASHVNAAMRKDVIRTFPIGTTPGASAVDDVLLARRAEEAGLRIAYAPRMLVRHHDVQSWRGELAKNRREGLGLGEHSRELGLRLEPLAWGLLLLTALAWFAVQPGPLPLVAAVLVLWLPTLRRAARRARAMPPRDLALGVAASPAFDLAFLLAYLRGLARRKSVPVPPRRREVDP